MAQRVVVELVDDLDNTPIAEGKGETVSFGLDGKDYEIDLKTQNAKNLRKALEPYVAVAARAKKTTGKRGGSRARAASDSGDIRAWAKTNGHEVSERGRISAEIRQAYEEANA